MTTNNKSRIAKAERTHKAKAGSSVPRFYIYTEGKEDTGRLDNVPMSRTEFEKIKKGSDVEIVIQYASRYKDGDE